MKVLKISKLKSLETKHLLNFGLAWIFEIIFFKSSSNFVYSYVKLSFLAIEAIYSIMAMNTGDIPPTLNLEEQEDGTEGFDLVPLKSKHIEGIKCVLSNSFGFGGTNASLIFGKAP